MQQTITSNKQEILKLDNVGVGRVAHQGEPPTFAKTLPHHTL
jgi:hypothetical protein